MKIYVLICCIAVFSTGLNAGKIYGVGADSCSVYIESFNQKDDPWAMVPWMSWITGYISNANKSYKNFDTVKLMIDIKQECKHQPSLTFAQAANKSLNKIEVHNH